jgi:hypothetical protein
MSTGLIGIFIIYIIQGLALIAMPTVNKPLYESAGFKPPVWVLYLLGGITVISMGFFMAQIIADVFLWTLGGVTLGTLVYFLGRSAGKKEGFDYEARMAKDFQLVEQETV